jgi:hypothetical protein
MLLKTGMVLSGKDCPRQADGRGGGRRPRSAACVGACPPAVPGIVFLSGGQGVEATQRLNAICRAGGPVDAELLVRPRAPGRGDEAWRARPPTCRPPRGPSFTARACNALAVQGTYSEKADEGRPSRRRMNKHGSPGTPRNRSPRRIGIAADHGGFELKQHLVGMLREAGHLRDGLWRPQLQPDDDYPDFVVPLARAVAAGEVTAASPSAAAASARRRRQQGRRASGPA